MRYKVENGLQSSNPPMLADKAVLRYIFCVLNCHVFGADHYRTCTKKYISTECLIFMIDIYLIQLDIFIVVSMRFYLISVLYSLPIEIALEKRCAKFIHSCLNSNNLNIKTTSISAITTYRSQFRDNYRYICYEYKILRNLWFLPIGNILQYIQDSIVKYVCTSPEGAMIYCILLYVCELEHVNL